MSDYAAIEEVIALYFEGFKTKDRAKLERVFATDVAQMISYCDDGNGNLELTTISIDKAIDGWVDPTFVQPRLGTGEIISIQRFGAVGASVLFNFGGVYLDELQMVNLAGEWRVANKFCVDNQTIR